MGIKFKLANTPEEAEQALGGEMTFSTTELDGGGCELEIHDVEGDKRDLDIHNQQEPADTVKLFRMLIDNGLTIHPDFKKAMLANINSARLSFDQMCTDAEAKLGFIDGKWHDFD